MTRAAGLVAIVIAAGIGLSASSPQADQTSSAHATITGRVTDTTNGVIPGATITVTGDTNSNSNRYIAITSGAGIYRINDVQPGNYWIETKLSGFKTKTDPLLISA